MDTPRFGTRRVARTMSILAAMAAATASAVRVPLTMLSRRDRERLKSGRIGNSHTYWPPSKRNGARERDRRMRQMANGTHGYTRAE